MKKLAFAKSCKELEVYKASFRLQQAVFKLTKSFPSEEKFSLSDQIRRSPVLLVRIFQKHGPSGDIWRISLANLLTLMANFKKHSTGSEQHWLANMFQLKIQTVWQPQQKKLAKCSVA